jgi:NDP-sugar pyrophosphorylase family protein
MRQQIIRHALIMAAGRGNRMRPLTDLLPKPMINYKGDTLIGNSLQMLKNNIPHIHVTVGYKKAMLSEYLMTQGGVDTIINTEGHGNAWWLQHTLARFMDEPILVLTTDNITELDLEFLSSEYARLNCPACMIVPVVPIEGVDGDYIEQENGIVRSLQRIEPMDSYCSGIQVLNPKHVLSFVEAEDELDGFYEVWSRLISQQELKVSLIYPKTWFSVDTLEQLVKINQ